jgi:hypothetical protein
MTTRTSRILRAEKGRTIGKAASYELWLRIALTGLLATVSHSHMDQWGRAWERTVSNIASQRGGRGKS